MKLERSILSGLKEAFGVESKRVATLKSTWKSRMETVLGEGELKINGKVLTRTENGTVCACLYFVQRDKSSWVISSQFSSDGKYLCETGGNLKGMVITGPHTCKGAFGEYDPISNKLNIFYGVPLGMLF